MAVPSGVPVSKALRRNSLPSTKVRGFGEMRRSTELSSVYWNSNSWTVGSYPAAVSWSTT